MPQRRMRSGNSQCRNGGRGHSATANSLFILENMQRVLSSLSSVGSHHLNLCNCPVRACAGLTIEVSGLSPRCESQLSTWLVNSELTWYRMLTQANQSNPTPTTDRNNYSNHWVPGKGMYVSRTYFCQSTYKPQACLLWKQLLKGESLVLVIFGYSVLCTGHETQ